MKSSVWHSTVSPRMVTKEQCSQHCGVATMAPRQQSTPERKFCGT